MKHASRLMPATIGLLSLLALPSAAADFIVPSGQTIIYDTTLGPLVVDNFIIQPNAILRVQGPNPFSLTAKAGVVIDGVLDLSGFDRADIATLVTGNQPEPGASGAAGGGAGGVASFLTTTSTAMGGAGFGSFQVTGFGGQGGEAGYGIGAKEFFRGAGGGGGSLGPDLPGQAVPGLVGLMSKAGFNGGTGAVGPVFGLTPPRGGPRGASAFADADPTNDFWGFKLDPMTGAIQQGELDRPLAGTGGGAGGDGIQSSSFPPSNWTPGTDKKGCGGGGGGGLALLQARYALIGSGGQILLDGGRGGSGENMQGTDHIGGASGGGSGGYLLLQAALIDMSQASPDCLSALGGAGGKGKQGHNSKGAGGSGGAGIIQLHVNSASQVILPAGNTLSDMSIPDAHVLLPIL